MGTGAVLYQSLVFGTVALSAADPAIELYIFASTPPPNFYGLLVDFS